MFDFHHREPDRWSYETSPYERERFAAVLKGIGPGPHERVLEVGCSEGVFTRALAADDRVGTVTAADVSPRALETARRRCEGQSNVSFVSGSIVNAAPPGPFDLIICSEVLYYVGGRRAAVARELAQRLAPGGIMVLEHVHPESGRLHAPFIHSAGLEVLERTVVRHALRPFEVLALRRPA
jgi:2-polyprenyl-3-methyl-5-hydroxy-6-metoxy-1,4-benzoquinol methylase